MKRGKEILSGKNAIALEPNLHFSRGHRLATYTTFIEEYWV